MVLTITAALMLSGCSAAMMGGIAEGMARGAAGASTPGMVSSPKLMIFGGRSHKTYLGCLNCYESARDSVFNEYGPYGNPYSGASIWNLYSQFGSAYSVYGACNPYATDPPVIVDEQGNFYGRLTVNKYHSQIRVGETFYTWLSTVVCER